MMFKDSLISNYWQDFVSLLFPETCISCNDTLRKNENQICTACILDLPVTNYHLSLNENPVYNDLKIIENITGAAAYIKYHKLGIAQKMLKQLKYQSNYEIGFLLGKWYGNRLVDVIHADLMIPVPIHKSKYKKRGYNQSVAIAEGLQQYLNIPMDTDSVIRSRKTNTQTKRHKVDRWNAMSEVFSLTSSQNITNKDILVIDDVITTGATIFSLCDTINKAQPKSIQILAVASGK